MIRNGLVLGFAALSSYGQSPVQMRGEDLSGAGR